MSKDNKVIITNKFDKKAKRHSKQYTEEINKINTNEVLSDVAKKTLLEEAENREYWRKRRKKLLFFSYGILVYIISIVIFAIIPLFIPSLSKFSDYYLNFCNIVSTFLCVWSLFRVRKTDIMKEKLGATIVIICVLAILMNIGTLVLNSIGYW